MNFKMEIILTEQSTLATNGNALDANLPTTYPFFKISKTLTEINACSLLIKHGTLTGYTKSSSHWLIETGGSKKDIPPTDKANAGQISWNTFIENIENFLNHIKDKTEITKEDIEILYAIDPELEKLLEPFANILPLSENWGSNLNSAKDELIKEISKKLK